MGVEEGLNWGGGRCHGLATGITLHKGQDTYTNSNVGGY